MLLHILEVMLQKGFMQCILDTCLDSLCDKDALATNPSLYFIRFKALYPGDFGKLRVPKPELLQYLCDVESQFMICLSKHVHQPRVLHNIKQDIVMSCELHLKSSLCPSVLETILTVYITTRLHYELPQILAQTLPTNKAFSTKKSRKIMKLKHI